jgi:hypothetical protein
MKVGIAKVQYSIFVIVGWASIACTRTSPRVQTDCRRAMIPANAIRPSLHWCTSSTSVDDNLSAENNA